MSTSTVSNQFQAAADNNIVAELSAKLHAAVTSFIAFLGESSEERERKYQEAYLAEATDVYDLEHRSRELDRNQKSVPQWMRG